MVIEVNIQKPLILSRMIKKSIREKKPLAQNSARQKFFSNQKEKEYSINREFSLVKGEMDRQV